MQNLNGSMLAERDILLHKSDASIEMIINADDFGICQERDSAIFELFEKGFISSASCLVQGYNTKQSLTKAFEIQMPVGIHINLTEGEPVYKNSFSTLSYFNSDLQRDTFYGKFTFRDKLSRNEISLDDIKNEIIQQIIKFTGLYHNLPVHVDGHQHVHLIPFIAKIISEVCGNIFGIYRTRIPHENICLIEQNVQNEQCLNFYREVITQSKESESIYTAQQMYSTDHFMGMCLIGQNCSVENFNQCLEKINSGDTRRCVKTVEFMCHPGIPSPTWDEFNNSPDRLHEKNSIEKIFTSGALDKGQLITYSDIHAPIDRKFNIAILGDITYGTGNCITARRFRSIFSKLNYNCFLFQVKHVNNPQLDYNEEYNIKLLEQFLISNHIHLIVGINIWRSGRVISLLNNQQIVSLKLPYIFIIAGTDANHFIKETDKKELMKGAINSSSHVISFNEEMITNIQKEIQCDFKFSIVPQSVEITERGKEERFSIRRKLNISDDFKISILPISIRKVKDPMYVLKEMIQLLNENLDHYFLLIGAVHDLTLFEEVQKAIDNHPRFIIHDVLTHDDYIDALKECNLIINTSINEGMSNALMEAMKVGVPVLARENEGNCSLVQHRKNGMIFANPYQFYEMYREIYFNENTRTNLIQNAQNTIEFKFNYQAEVESYQKILPSIISDYYRTLWYNDNLTFHLLFLPRVHPFSEENNEIFSNAKVEKYENGVRILDVGCGAGIFSFLFLLNNNQLRVDELVLTDIEDNCLSSSLMAFTYYQRHFNIKKLRIVKSDLLESISRTDESKSFDIVLANLPQTPSLNSIRKDKHGGKEGPELYIEMFTNLSTLIHEKTEIFILHISLCYPNLLEETLACLKYQSEIIFEQVRYLNPEDLNSLTEGLMDYFIQLNDEGKCIFEKSEYKWKYWVWLKHIKQLP